MAAPWSMQIVIRVCDRATRSQSDECTIFVVNLRFAIIDMRTHTRVQDYAFPLQSCDPGEIHFDPWIISRDPSDSASRFPRENPENVVGKPVGNGIEGTRDCERDK